MFMFTPRSYEMSHLWTTVVALTVLLTGIRSDVDGDGCKAPATLTGSTGQISSPYYHYPQYPYPNSLKCRWTINVPEGQNVRIEFSAPMRLEAHNSCAYDWVAIFANNGTLPAICSSIHVGNATAGPYCPAGTPPPPPPQPVVISGNSVYVEFCTDRLNGYRGFELTYTATDEAPTPITTTAPPPITTTAPPPVASPCDTNLTLTYTPGDMEQYIQSPNNSDIYPGNAVCTWYITAPDAEGLRFTAEVFDLGAYYIDTLTFTDVSGPTAVNLGVFTGQAGPQKLRSIGNRVRVVFTSKFFFSFPDFRVRIDKPPCLVGYGYCPNTGEEEHCFHSDQLCNGNQDCPKGTDEFCPAGCGVPVKKPLLGARETRIIGGSQARPHTWPWQVAMISQLATVGDQFCGGSIIDHHWIITAAHCCEHDTSIYAGPNSYKVRVGEHDLNGDEEVNAWTYDVEAVIKHPQYNRTTKENDICLLKTAMPIFFNDDVYPVCLGTDTDTSVGTDCYISGWGISVSMKSAGTLREIPDTLSANVFTEKDEQLNVFAAARNPNVLHQVDVKIIGQDTCNLAHNNSVISEDVICAHSPGKDSCLGDGGGPLVCPSQSDPTVWELTGVVSTRTPTCAVANMPGSYARTSHFLDWIAKTMTKS